MLKRGIGASILGNSGNGMEKWEETKRLVACLVENSSNSVAYIIPSSLLLIILHSLVPDAHATIYTISKKVAIPYFLEPTKMHCLLMYQEIECFMKAFLFYKELFQLDVNNGFSKLVFIQF